MTTLLGAMMLLATPLLPPHEPAEAPPSKICFDARITGYVRTEFSPWTADGTSVYTDEPIAAASNWIPFDSYVIVDGLGTFRVADRGYLGPAHIDVAVWSYAEAYAITSVRNVCVNYP